MDCDIVGYSELDRETMHAAPVSAEQVCGLEQLKRQWESPD